MRQASANAPAEVELSLTNGTADPLSVGPFNRGREPFEVIDPLEGETGVVWLLEPGSPYVTVMGGTLPTEPVNGCWRVVDDDGDDDRTPYLATVNYSRPVEIGPGATYTVRHEAYYLGPERTCFPPGDYRTTVEVAIEDVKIGPRMAVTYVLSVSEDGSFGVTVDSVEYIEDPNR